VRQTLLILFCVSMAEVACGGAGGAPNAPAAKSEIARIHRAKCGSCHVRVEPGERTRAELEEAFTRHRKRARLSEEQWAQMVDYLAAAADASAAGGTLADGARQ
jgi:hypothetical protein